LLNHKDIDGLQSLDQLKKEMDRDRVFSGFHEILPDFNPTYRMVRNELKDGQRIYSDEKNRVPSWCDRILWKEAPGNFIERKLYNSCCDIITSDHTPIYATFELNARLHPKLVWGLSKEPKPIVTHYPLVRIFDLKGKHIKYVKKFENVSVSVFCDLLSKNNRKKAKSERKRCQLDVTDWDQLLTFELNCFEKEYIEEQHMIFSVRGFGSISKIPLGQGFVTLKNACGVEPVDFEVGIYHLGTREGLITGKIHVINVVTCNIDLKL